MNKKDVVKAIRLTWGSLESHLDFSVEKRKLCEECGDSKFHKKCVKEYGFVLKVLTDLL